MPLEETTEEGHIREIKLPCYLLYTKLAIAQAKRPRWVFLDEATSAMDEETESRLYGHLAALPGITVVSVGHRSTLDVWHGRVWSLQAEKH